MTDAIDVARINEDQAYRDELRLRAQTDLLWLAKFVLGYSLIDDIDHREIADMFVRKDPSKPIEEQSEVKVRIVLMPRRTFKALALDTRIPTPSGFVLMRDVKVGDTVFSEKGMPIKVIGVSPVYSSNRCFEVEFSTGEVVTADAGHLWETDARKDRDARKNLKAQDGKMLPWPTVKTTLEIAETVMCRNENNHRVKIAGPLQLPDAELPIPPYVLGCWLGDGNKNGLSITCGDQQIIEEISREGEIIRFANCSDPYRWVFNGGPEHPDYRMRKASFAGRIKHLGLQDNKHIPETYLRASESQRLALLQGLMDTDGTAAKRDGALVFSNTNLRLVNDVKQLVASLGFKALIHGPYVAKLNGQDAGFFYHVAFKAYTEAKIFRLARKQALVMPRAKVSLQGYRSIVRVEEVESVPVKCIMVDSPSQLYLVTDGFIPTHNSTFNIADAIQWILCFPEVAVMVMTASNSPDSPLADAFVMECAMHFYAAPAAPLKILHMLFPEHVLHKLPKAGEFTTPARSQFRRDPTVKGVSIEQSLSGWHPDILKGEDIQDNRNSQTGYALRKVWKNLQVNIKMLPNWGYRDHTGTRYGPADVYSRMLENPGPRTIILWKPAYLRRPHALGLEDGELTEGDVILQFPRLLPWEYLRSVKQDDEESFWTQYMNIAEGNFKPTFPQERLMAAKVAAEHAPDEQKAHIAWRFEYAECKHAACAVGIERTGRMTIVEVLRGQFVPTQLARRVVLTAKKWEAHRVEIEDTPGARSMIPHIRNVALENDWRVELHWSPFMQDDTARSLAIKSAEPHLLAGKLLFADDLVNGTELFRQLYQFGMVEEYELASVVSRVANKLPASNAAEGFEAQDENAFAAYAEQDAYDRVYGRGRYKEQEPILEVEEAEWQPSEPGAGLEEMMPGLSG